jgi:hypothetical protein
MQFCNPERIVRNREARCPDRDESVGIGQDGRILYRRDGAVSASYLLDEALFLEGRGFSQGLKI